MSATDIGWATDAWNPTGGCTLYGPECLNCYAMPLAHRLAAMGVEKYQGLTRKNADGKVVWNGQINEADHAGMEWPLTKLTPRLIFVNSMSDLGHEKIRMETFVRIFQVMMRADWHIFQVLTKRPEIVRRRLLDAGMADLPPHIWIGVSVGMPETKHRIDVLRETPAGMRFLSLEPLIARLGDLDLRGIDWAIAGGESGSLKTARPLAADTVREIRDQCVEAGVAFFLKQWGQWANNPLVHHHGLAEAKRIEARLAGRSTPLADKKGGCSLDGQIWVQLPEAGAVLLKRRKAAATVPDLFADIA